MWKGGGGGVFDTERGGGAEFFPVCQSRGTRIFFMFIRGGAVFFFYHSERGGAEKKWRMLVTIRRPAPRNK